LLRVDESHHRFWITLAGCGTEGEHFAEASEFVGAQLYIERAYVFFQILSVLGAWYGNDVSTLRQDPGQRQLRGLTLFLFRHFLNFLDEIQIELEILSLKTRRVAAVVVGGKVFKASGTVPVRKPRPKRAVRDEADTEFAASGQNLWFGIARPERIFALQGGDGMDVRWRCGESSCAASERSEIADLAFLYKLGHGGHRLFDGRIGIDAVLVVEIDISSTPRRLRLASQDLLERSPACRRSPRFWGLLGSRTIPNLVARMILSRLRPLMARPTSSSFVCGTIDVSGVEKGNTEFEGAMDGGDGFIVVASGVKVGHTHATEAESGDLQTGTAEFEGSHG
jgi:hypothetical protein